MTGGNLLVGHDDHDDHDDDDCIVSNAAWSVNDRSLSASLNRHFVTTVSVFLFVLQHYLHHLYLKRN